MGNKTGFQLASGAPQIYEKVLVPLWFGRWARALLQLVDIRPGDAVLDVACGTGVTTRLAQDAAGNDGHVTGLDINAPMLEIARDLSQGSAIDWIKGDVADTGLGSGTVDVVISQHGYHYFPDKPRALVEIHRVLVPKGRCAFSIWEGHSAYTSALCGAVEKYISQEIAQKQRSQRVTPGSEQLALALENAGFNKISVHKQRLDIHVPMARTFVPLHLGSMPIAAAFNALAEAEKDALIGDVEDALADYVQGDEIVYPDTVYVAIGSK